MLRDYGRALTIVISGLFYHTAFASNSDTSPLTTSPKAATNAFVASLSLGPSWGSAGSNQTLNLAPGVTKTYTADQPDNTMANYDLFLGFQTALTEKLQGQLGLDFAATSGATLSGDIWDDANPMFDNYTYQYSIRHQQIALKGKLLGNFGWPVQPWLSATAGVGFNRSYDFSNTPTIDEAVASPNFSDHTVTAFTYAVGIGIEHALSKHCQVGLGYEFSDWGKSQLGSAEGSTTNQAPSLSHFYTSALLLNITYHI